MWGDGLKKRFWSPKVKAIVIIAVVLAVLTMVAAAVSSGTPFGENLVGTLLSPFRAGVAAIDRQAERYYNYLFSYESLQAENAELQKKVLSMSPAEALGAGEVGYLTASIKTISDTRVGDTVTGVQNPAKTALPGYKQAQPMVFSGVYPADGSKYGDLRDALEKLKLNDASMDNISKKKLKQQEKDAADRAAKEYEAKKRGNAGESSEQPSAPGDAARPYSRGRAYSPGRYGKDADSAPETGSDEPAQETEK